MVDGRYALDGYRTAFGLCWLLQVASVAWLAYAERSGMRRGALDDAADRRDR